MRIFEDLDADEQQAFINYLRDYDIDVNTTDEYEIFDEKEAQERLEKRVEEELTEAGHYYPLLVKSFDEAMKMYSLDDIFIEIGAGMFIYN